MFKFSLPKKSVLSDSNLKLNKELAANIFYALGTWFCLLVGILFFQANIPSRTIYPENSGIFSRLLQALTSWDTGHYLAIADHNYLNLSDFAFFPLLPTQIYSLSFFGLSLSKAAIVTSLVNLVFLVAAFTYFCRKYFPESKNYVTGLFSLPYSFFFLFPYTESLYLGILFTILYFLSSQKSHSRLLLILGAFFLSLTRSVGLMFFPAMLVFLLAKWRQNELNPSNFLTYVLALIANLAGFLLYLFINWRQSGNAFTFIKAQASWGRTSTWAIWEPLLSNFQSLFQNTCNSSLECQINLVSPLAAFLLGLISSLIFFFCFKAKSLPKPIHLFILTISICSCLFPLLSNSLTSFNRYYLAAPSVLLLFVWALQKIPSEQIRLLVHTYLFALNLLLAVFFATGGWVG